MINPAIEPVVLSLLGVDDLPEELSQIIDCLKARNFTVAAALEAALCNHTTDLAKRSFAIGWDLAKHPEKLIFSSASSLADDLDQELEEIVNQHLEE